MKTIVHLSDLHFGTEDPDLVEHVLADVRDLNPTLVTVSGDLTQRARSSQFAAARAFLSRIQQPLLVVPGNHDVPLDNLLRRFWRPLEGYQRYISENLAPSFGDEELTVVGLNTARSNTWKGGRISRAQIEHLRTVLSHAPALGFKVLVTHHPFLPPPDDPTRTLVGRGFEALQVAEACGIDLILAGHLHVGYSGDVRTQHVRIRRSILVIQAGTALSRRTRHEPNAYNVITIDLPRLVISVRAWNGQRFAPMKGIRYVKREDEWRRVLESHDSDAGT